MKIQILGTGCAKCRKLYEQAERAVSEGGFSAELEKVERIEEILTYGVPVTPALLIDGEVKSAGRIPEKGEIATWLKQAAATE